MHLSANKSNFTGVTFNWCEQKKNKRHSLNYFSNFIAFVLNASVRLKNIFRFTRKKKPTQCWTWAKEKRATRKWAKSHFLFIMLFSVKRTLARFVFPTHSTFQCSKCKSNEFCFFHNAACGISDRSEKDQTNGKNEPTSEMEAHVVHVMWLNANVWFAIWTNWKENETSKIGTTIYDRIGNREWSHHQKCSTLTRNERMENALVRTFSIFLNIYRLVWCNKLKIKRLSFFRLGIYSRLNWGGNNVDEMGKAIKFQPKYPNSWKCTAKKRATRNSSVFFWHEFTNSSRGLVPKESASREKKLRAKKRIGSQFIWS